MGFSQPHGLAANQTVPTYEHSKHPRLNVARVPFPLPKWFRSAQMVARREFLYSGACLPAAEGTVSNTT